MVAIIDAHHHFFDLQRFRYPFLDDEAFAVLRSPYAVPEFLADIGGLAVVGSVHVQAEVDHAVDPVLETAWLQSIAEASGPCRLPSVAIAYADLRRADLEETLSRHCQYEVMRGIRQEAWFDPSSTRSDIPNVNLLEDPNWRAGYRRLGAFGLSFDMLVWPWQLKDAAEFVGSIPEVPVILEHLGMPTVGDPCALETWRAGMRAMADIDHVAVKISALGQIDGRWTTGTLSPLVLETIDLFGVDRCMFGSNFPVEKLTNSYRAAWAAFEQLCTGFSEVERNKLFHGNAQRIYCIDIENPAMETTTASGLQR